MPRLDAPRLAAWRWTQRSISQIEALIDDDLRGEWGVPLAWFDLLAALAARSGSARPSELSAELSVDRTTLSRRLDRLTDEGWVARRPAPAAADHRTVVVELTDRGRRLWRETSIGYRRSVQRRFAGRLSDADIDGLTRILRQIEP